MTSATNAATANVWDQRRNMREDRRARVQSRQKRAQLLDQISQHPDADEGLRAQARLYRERLEAGMDEASS